MHYTIKEINNLNRKIYENTIFPHTILHLINFLKNNTLSADVNNWHVELKTNIS